LGYKYPKPKIIEMHRYGIPQRRRRIVLIASRLDEIDYPEETHDGKKVRFTTVFDKIGGINALPKIEAGEMHSKIPNHQSAGLSPLNLERIKAIPVGKNRLVLPDNLRLACHKDKDSTHTDVYGRLFWHEPATGLTTRCTSLSNGRFGHPDQHRAISAREAARLQTFSDTFVFEGGINAVARQIGNAVPVELAQKFGEKFVRHLEEYILKLLSNSDG
jgi:DNA (cytosine-5)-methyltransferase 1